MPDFRYPQFCPLARAAEIVGERWTLLIVRELLLGPKRFSDLERPLTGVSTSVLAERLARLEERGLVARRELPPPAPATVYELSESGAALLPVVVELVRWGSRFLGPPQRGEYFDPAWVRLGLLGFSRRDAAPSRSYDVTVSDGEREDAFHVVSGPDGVHVAPEHSGSDLALSGPPLVVLGVAMGGLDPQEAIRSGALRAEGDVATLADFPRLFETPST